jgi:hypothetical protein
MIEMRWVWHDLNAAMPPTGAICISEEIPLYQKLQYRYLHPVKGKLLSGMPEDTWEWSEWKDVLHKGMEDSAD